MKVALFDSHKFERPVIDGLNQDFGFEITHFETRLEPKTARLAKGADVVCCFAHDKLNAQTIKTIKELGVKLIALRSAGFNHVDLKAAREADIPVVRVPEYSPYAVAEHAAGLVLSLNRKIHRAYQRCRELDFSLDGLMGFDLHGKTVAILGTGRIGAVFASIMNGFGCRLLAYDINKDERLEKELGVVYADLKDIYAQADIISLHLPLTPDTKHLIDRDAFSKMKKGAMLINTGRGALIDTPAMIEALKSGKLGSAGLDVYEEEEEVFFKDLSDNILTDDCLARLLTFPNVLVTSHQAFLTKEAVENIARTTLENIRDFQSGKELKNRVSLPAAR